jgi:hypothetical protein
MTGSPLYAAVCRRLADEPIVAEIALEEETDFHGGYELELGLWPKEGPRVVARMGYHGQWLEWLG